MDALDFQWKVLTGMRRVKEQTERTLQPCCTRHNITPVQLRILMTLRQDGPLTVSALARQSCVADANTSALCKRLGGQGFVQRTRDKADERHVLVSLTPRGTALLDEVGAACKEACEAVSRRLAPADMEELLAGIEKLLAVFDEEKETVS